MALIFAIGLLALLLLIGLVFAGNSINYRKVAENNSARSQARMFALSAVARASSSLMIYSHQYTRENPEGEPPKNLDHIFSFAKYGDDGSVSKSGNKIFTDTLFGEKSLMLLPGNYSIVNQVECLSFNERFKNASWSGSWVFFTNGRSGSDRRITGRAAWQVIGNSASIAAPVFMRGDLLTDSYNDDYVPRENRWGREIDEVFLDFENGVFANVDSVMDNVNTNEIPNYSMLYTTVGASDNKKLQRWVESWFLPELNDKVVKEASPMPGKFEAYHDDGEAISRFNISELYDGVEWDDKYSVVLKDQWYARMGINSKSDANSETALDTLTQDCDPVPNDKDHDFDVEVSNRSSLPFLRHIGDAQGTFGSLTDLRKQISANFNDYCDKDGIPTSNIAAETWLELIGKADGETDASGANVTTNHPLYTGNEKTPYLYEIGMNFGLVSNTENAQVVATKGEEGKFIIGLDVKAAPMIKLCNIYNFDPAEKIPMSVDAMYKEFGSNDFMRVYVDWDAFNLTFRLREAKLKDLEFSYVVTTVTETTTTDSEGNKTTEPKTETETRTFKYGEVKLASLDDDTNGPKLLNSVLTFTGSEWKRAGAADADGSVKIQPMAFSADELKNSDGTKPYPAKKSSSATDAFWQKTSPDADKPLAIDFTFDKGTLFEDITSGTAPDLKPGVEFVESSKSGTGTLDEYRKALGGVEETTTSQNGNVTTVTKTSYSKPELVSTLTTFDVVKIKVESFSVRPRRVILTANDGNLGKEIGVDYVRTLPEHKFSGQNIDLELNPVDGVIPGIMLGSFRNYDPRQNLNSTDWLVINTFARIDDFVKPADGVVDAGGVKLNCLADGMNTAENGDKNWFTPKFDGGDSKVMDWEAAEEPAFLGSAKNQHISTAVIRNAPMMSPWEIGFIHRACKWQTINLKKTASSLDEHLGVHEGAWDDASGTSYSGGDAAILEQIKMTDRIRSYGKININRLRTGDPNFKDHEEANKAIIKGIFQGIVYGEEPLEFITSSQRDADGKFGSASTSGKEIDGDMADKIVENFLAGSRQQYSRRVSFINWAEDDFCLGNGFHDNIVAVQDTDAAQEEIIGKTINLFSAEYSSPNIIELIVVAQSIRDVDGDQVKLSVEKNKDNFADPKHGTPDYADLADDGAIMMPCAYGRFDMLEHKTDSDLNVYFDEITGEVKMFVRLYYDAATGQMRILKIDYL